MLFNYEQYLRTLHVFDIIIFIFPSFNNRRLHCQYLRDWVKEILTKYLNSLSYKLKNYHESLSHLFTLLLRY